MGSDKAHRLRKKSPHTLLKPIIKKKKKNPGMVLVWGCYGGREEVKRVFKLGT